MTKYIHTLDILNLQHITETWLAFAHTFYGFVHVGYVKYLNMR